MFLREKVPDDSKYLRDRSSLRGHARYVILPNDEAELREGIRYASKGNTKVTISGNRTGKSGGAVPCGGDIMSMENLRGIIGVGEDEVGPYIRVLSCTTVSAFNNAVFADGVQGLVPENKDRFTGLKFPVRASPESSIGGCISANRSGIRPWVRRIKVVFSDSTFMTIERGEYKADGRRMTFPAGRNYFSFDLPDYDSEDDFGPKISEGMDLIDLFIGSEGVFGIITEADIYALPEASDSPDQDFGKMNNNYLKEKYGPKAVDDLKRIKQILDTNYILNIGNLF